MPQRQRHRRLRMECLEPRQLLTSGVDWNSVYGPVPDYMTANELAAGESSAELTVAEMASRLRSQQVSGATVITHGFQFSDSGGDSLLTLAQAVTTRADQQNGATGTAWLLNYSLVDHAGRIEGVFETANSILPPVGSTGTGEVVLLFDWARESNESSSGWGEAAGDALFNLIVELGLASPASHTSVPLHMIAHSFGSAVTSEAVERLAAFQIPVDHLTYLDPHDFDQGILPVDGKQRLFELGRPDGYGAAVWNNVSFADVYYQTEFAPDGRPIPGARNQLVNDLVSGIDAHSDVWNIVYLGTVQDANSVTGYGFSRIAGKPRPALQGTDQQSFRYYSNPASAQNHSHSPTSLVDQGRALTVDELNFARWTPRWNPYEIVNGDFEDPGDELVPGWIDHGGGRVVAGTCASPCGDAIDGSLVLSSRTTSRTHNRFYVPATAKTLQLDLRRGIASADDDFVVRLDGELLGTWPLSTTDPVITTRTLVIPRALRNQSHRLELAIVSKTGGVEGAVRVDNVRMSPLGNEAPTDVMLSSSTVSENVRGGEVGTITVVDPDIEDLHTITVDDPRFEVVSGKLKLANGVQLNFEQSPTVNLVLTARDPGGLSVTRQFTLQVVDQNDPPTEIRLSPSTLPERTSGATIGSLTAQDEDAGQSITFATSDPRLEIVGGQLRLRAGQSVEATASPLSVEVTANDSGSTPRSVTATLQVVITANPAPWRSTPVPEDVDQSGLVVPLDVLLIINELNTPSTIRSDWSLPRIKPASWPWFYDVNGDDYCTPLDVLQVINWINRPS